jgi:uncharacterized membrane protein (DUF2068 family)
MADPTIYDDGDDPYRPIRVGEQGPAGEAAKWGMLLSRFMRIVALFWLLQGLMHWRIVLTPQQSIFDTMPQNAAFAVIFFAVLDLVAGVGLWLATPWGGVLWLLIASAQIFLTLSMPGFFVGGRWLIAVNAILILMYFALTFEAGRDIDAQHMRERRRRKAQARAESPPPEG